MRHYTSIEQSKKLLELGLDPETADMHYMFLSDGIYATPAICAPPMDGDIPCWSALALLEVMPKKIEDKHYLMLGPAIKKNWCIAYMTQQHQYYRETADLIIDAVFQMVVWLLNDGLIKNVRPSQAAHPT